jgi:sugar lactone lactonase YvrE
VTTAASAGIGPIASFPPHFFLENLAVRANGSILVTVLNHKQLWYVPAPNGGPPVTPVLVHTLDGFAMGIVETEPDIFYVGTLDQTTLERFDMRGWIPGTPVEPTRVLVFDRGAGLNGACLLAPRVILLADSLAGLIWRVDLADGGLSATASVWLRHHSMATDPGNGFTSPLGPQPGINGIRFAARTNVVYYTSTAQRLFMRVAVDPATRTPVGQPEVVAADITADDFCLDENVGVAYLTTHTDNTIVRVPVDAGADGARTCVVAGDPFTEQLVGPSSAAWGRGPADYGRIAYVTTDGGHTAIAYHRPGSDDIIRPARVVRVQFEPEGPAHRPTRV